MSENRDYTDCDRFEERLLEADVSNLGRWRSHLEGCTACREQWQTHQMLVATFAEAEVPEISSSFQAGLDRKLEAALRVEPLKGWRLAALGAYALAAVALLRWIFVYFPLPTIDLSSPWTTVAALIIAPLSFLLTITATRLLPTTRPKGLRLLSL